MSTERVEELRELIRYHTELYTNNEPEITDAEFDDLLKELEELSPKDSVLLEIGVTPDSGEKVKHNIPMGSLDKITFEKDDQGEIIGDGLGLLNKWYKEHPEETCWSYKMDGVACELVYEKGNLVEASTRGDGSVGVDVTDNVRAVRSIPTKIDSEYLREQIGIEGMDCQIRIRGEILVSRDYFNKELVGSMKNPRNAAGGLLGQKSANEHVKAGLHLRCHGLFIDNQEPESDTDKEALVNSMKGFHGVNEASLKYVELHKGQLTADLIEELDKRREDFDFQTDGLVIGVNNTAKKDLYGIHGMNPKGKVAFKFKAEQVETAVVGITWQPGRTGRITPVAELSPVQIAGTTVSRCTLHNISEVKRIGIEIGDKVLIQKSGDIIPQVVRVLEKAENGKGINYPETCPVCGSFSSNDGKNIWCENPSCGNKKESAILHYLGTLGIKEIGPAMVSSLINAGYVNNIPSLYYLNIEDVLTLDNVGQRTAETVMNAILSVSEVDLEIFLASLGIRNLGNTLSKALAKEFKTLDKVLEAGEIDLINIPLVGEVVARSIVDGLESQKEVIEELRKIIEVKDYKEVIGIFSGKNFCCTGTLTRKRKEVQDVIASLGGNYISITKNLNFLIIGSGAVQSKIDKALSYGAQVLEEEEFIAMTKN